MTWKLPPRIKIYEALGAVADGRVAVSNEGAFVKSSSGRKTYEVLFDAPSKELSSNDNASYFVGYLGYPAVAFLLASGTIAFDREVARWLAGIAWKDVNTKLRNDYHKVEAFVRKRVADQGGDLSRVDIEIERITEQLQDLAPVRGSRRKRPPRGY